MTAPTLPPLLSSDGHLEVLPERWTPRMPAKYRERAPRTVKLPDGGDAILVEGQPPYPAPFLDLRAGRTNETWQPFGTTVEGTAGGGAPGQRPRGQDMEGLLPGGVFPHKHGGPPPWGAPAHRRLVPAARPPPNHPLAQGDRPGSRDPP